jgi:hypothetical protein
MQRDSIRRQESATCGNNKRNEAPASEQPQAKKWQEEVASSVAKMAEFIMKQQQQSAASTTASTTTTASAADAIVERLTRYHKLVDAAMTRLHKLQAEGGADESLERSVTKYKARSEELEAQLDEL